MFIAVMPCRGVVRYKAAIYTGALSHMRGMLLLHRQSAWRVAGIIYIAARRRRRYTRRAYGGRRGGGGARRRGAIRRRRIRGRRAVKSAHMPTTIEAARAGKERVPARRQQQRYAQRARSGARPENQRHRAGEPAYARARWRYGVAERREGRYRTITSASVHNGGGSIPQYRRQVLS